VQIILNNDNIDTVTRIMYRYYECRNASRLTNQITNLKFVMQENNSAHHIIPYTGVTTTNHIK
jgi:hypothetical protein